MIYRISYFKMSTDLQEHPNDPTSSTEENIITVFSDFDIDSNADSLKIGYYRIQVPLCKAYVFVTIF